MNIGNFMIFYRFSVVQDGIEGLILPLNEAKTKKLPIREALYPGPGSNRHGFPQVFETSASTNSATRAFDLV